MEKFMKFFKVLPNKKKILKVHYCRFENLPKCLCSYVDERSPCGLSMTGDIRIKSNFEKVMT